MDRQFFTVCAPKTRSSVGGQTPPFANDPAMDAMASVSTSIEHAEKY